MGRLGRLGRLGHLGLLGHASWLVECQLDSVNGPFGPCQLAFNSKPFSPCSCYDGPCRKLFLLAMLVLAMLVPAKNFFWSLFLAKNFFFGSCSLLKTFAGPCLRVTSVCISVRRLVRVTSACKSVHFSASSSFNELRLAKMCLSSQLRYIISRYLDPFLYPGPRAGKILCRSNFCKTIEIAYSPGGKIQCFVPKMDPYIETVFIQLAQCNEMFVRFTLWPLSGKV